MVCREADGLVAWPTIRERMGELLDEEGWKLLHGEQAAAAGQPDPATWGLSPEAIRAQERAMAMGGGVGE